MEFTTFINKRNEAGPMMLIYPVSFKSNLSKILTGKKFSKIELYKDSVNLIV